MGLPSKYEQAVWEVFLLKNIDKKSIEINVPKLNIIAPINATGYANRNILFTIISINNRIYFYLFIKNR